jgi:hypothetical protein
MQFGDLRQRKSKEPAGRRRYENRSRADLRDEAEHAKWPGSLRDAGRNL